MEKKKFWLILYNSRTGFSPLKISRRNVCRVLQGSAGTPMFTAVHMVPTADCTPVFTAVHMVPTADCTPMFTAVRIVPTADCPH
jgi:hypothetical protein